LAPALADTLFPAAGLDVAELLDARLGDEARARRPLPRVADPPLVVLVLQRPLANRSSSSVRNPRAPDPTSLALAKQGLCVLRPGDHLAIVQAVAGSSPVVSCY
jgi:hypothetical protein